MPVETLGLEYWPDKDNAGEGCSPATSFPLYRQRKRKQKKTTPSFACDRLRKSQVPSRPIIRCGWRGQSGLSNDNLLAVYPIL